MKHRIRNYAFLITLILLGIIICWIAKLPAFTSGLIGFLVAIILSAGLQAKDEYLIRMGKVLKMNTLFNIGAYLVVIVIILFVVKNIYAFFGFSLYIVVSRLILYNSMKKLISEDYCGC